MRFVKEAPPLPVTRPLRILAVDDQSFMRRLIGIELNQNGNKVELAGSGSEALEIIQKSPPFDVVLVDRLMPIMDGFHTARQILRIAREKMPVIILMSAEVSGTEIQMANALGIHHVLEKPIHLRDVINVWMENQKLSKKNIAP